jgi:hypothetical protein
MVEGGFEVEDFEKSETDISGDKTGKNACETT